ncbi:hypothetical protein GCM10007857_42960 [Bradyrhizobium iriomotense]|uniref:Uncharacterized protein n=1 Tax=Bradyrhizobium iriomotense TaxID=441950 RepID=A0ABQ6B1M2_9BRAD|nr:hypothetical protein GCM10007857_42960 [Bradyrhizobium iriomotense]
MLTTWELVAAWAEVMAAAAIAPDANPVRDRKDTTHAFHVARCEFSPFDLRDITHLLFASRLIDAYRRHE